MTRFARAKGSKGANERLPEAASSWQEMKQELIQSQAKSKEDKESNFQMDVEEKNEKAQWADFPQITTKSKKRKNQESGNSNSALSAPKKLKNNESKAKKVKKVKSVENNTSAEGIEPINVNKSNDFEDASTKTGPIKIKKAKKLKTVTENSLDAVGTTSVESVEKKKKLKKKKKVEATSDSNENKLSNDSNQQTEIITNKKFDKRNGPQNLKKDKFANQNKFSKNQQQNNYQSGNNKERNFDYQRRKPQVDTIFINGVKIEVMLYDGFPVQREDYERLKQLKQDMINKGIPHSEIAKALKLQRRRAEKVLARAKKSVCFNCRKGGHNISECPSLQNNDNPEIAGTGICFKCGSTQHTHFQCQVVRNDNFKFAQCFICKERGHISRQCPDNSRGIYPKGGACKLCGDVTHLKQNCPKRQMDQQESAGKFVLSRIGDNVEDLDNEPTTKVVKKTQKLPKVIKFA